MWLKVFLSMCGVSILTFAMCIVVPTSMAWWVPAVVALMITGGVRTLSLSWRS